MSKTEILEERPKLTKAERFEIRLKLAELDGDGWLVLALSQLLQRVIK